MPPADRTSVRPRYPEHQSRERPTNHAFFVFSCRNIFCDNDGISLDELVFLLALVAMHACLDLTFITELTQSASLMHDQQRFNYLAIQVWTRLQHFLNRDFHFARAQEKKPGALLHERPGTRLTQWNQKFENLPIGAVELLCSRHLVGR